MFKYTRNKKNIKTVDMVTFVFKTFKELYKKKKKNYNYILFFCIRIIKHMYR
jgi:hypothetical protein